MSPTIPSQHPAVVLRSHYQHVRAMLAIAMIAVVGLTAALVVVATDGDSPRVTRSSAPAATSSQPGDVRYDGGPEEGTRGVRSPSPSGLRYDGGPEEGSSLSATR